MKKKKERTQIKSEMKEEKQQLTLQKKRDCKKILQLYGNKLDNLDEREKFLET